jgi:hypothetical protein
MKETKDLFNENYKPLKRKVKEKSDDGKSLQGELQTPEERDQGRL